jgi:uncharacterized protein YbaR (Trm112 family)
MNTERGLSEGTSQQQPFAQLPRLPEGLSCPSCRGTLNWDSASVRCDHCGRRVPIHGGRIPDFLAGEDRVVDAILCWPDSFMQHAEPWLLAVASDRLVSAEASAELQAMQLLESGDPRGDNPGKRRIWRLDSGSRLTALGSNLAYHCAEFALQSTRDSAGDFLKRFVHLSALGAEATVLDVGCGAGQTLRLLQPYQPAERIGFDIDLVALAFGCRLAESHSDTIRFVRASAYHIPFRDNRFTHVICRIALNYLQQGRALAEMIRVLQPDGHLYCTVEGPGFDLQFLQQARTAAQVLCRLRDLFYGLILALTGMQPTPGRRLTGGRAFGNIRRCTQFLTRAGCEMIRVEISSRHLGMPVAFDLVARKR